MNEFLSSRIDALIVLMNLQTNDLIAYEKCFEFALLCALVISFRAFCLNFFLLIYDIISLHTANDKGNICASSETYDYFLTFLIKWVHVY